jgi:enoyl-CoA hydratase/carnithine racemase
MSYETILYETRGQIAYITLNRPRVLNAYNDTMGDELLQAHRAFDQDDDLHVLIISGAGRAFCSGADVRQRQLRPVDELKRLGGLQEASGRPEVCSGSGRRSTGSPSSRQSTAMSWGPVLPWRWPPT